MKTSSLFAAALMVLVLGTPGKVATAQQRDPIYDEDLKIVDWAELGYPGLAYSAKIEGVVVVQVALDSQGAVLDAVGLSGSKLLVPTCLLNAKKWRFQPTSRNSAIIVYNFRMDKGFCRTPNSFFGIQPPNFVTVIGCKEVI
jgi:hypothetical protein